MGLNERIKPTQQALGVTAVSGAAPQTVTGNTVIMNKVETGSLSATVYTLATTNTLTLTAKWQVSDDGSTWVAQVTGTGSAVSATRVIPAPDSVYGKRRARCVVVSGTGSGGGAGQDEANISYNYRLHSSHAG